MRPNITYLQQQFEYWNGRVFDGALPPVPIVLSCAKSFLGRCEYRVTHSYFGTKHSDFRLKFSDRFDLEECVLVDTLLHEMIHYYIAYKGICDTSAHGKVFRQMMSQINARYDRHITVSHRTTDAERSSITARECYVFCLSTLTGGRQGITVSAKTRVFYLWDKLPTLPEVVATAWYISTDTELSRYPRSQQPRIYGIDERLISRVLASAKPLARKDNKIFVAK